MSIGTCCPWIRTRRTGASSSRSVHRNERLMDWSASGAPLVATRAVHFAATAVMVGNIVFGTLIAMPVLRSEPATAAALRVHLTRLSWFGLAMAVISGAIWL